MVEWHDVGYSGTLNLCTYQALFYDVTNEIEFHYDTGCNILRLCIKDTKIGTNQGCYRKRFSRIHHGANPHSNNYRIGTDGSGHSYETFDLVKELQVSILQSGSSNGARGDLLHIKLELELIQIWM